ncbi:hypothetical protein DB32_002486 [Sandaracinus amylolyticus]|uniref:Uncharacterized protein n=1 Tax=Sandaracinus amylolyticus TaxID=927083 RepID=A0A0F6W1U5_9BACT|nr:hypothetical protein DB32_002486 [Sandaracinus amylolyticus]
MLRRVRPRRVHEVEPVLPERDRVGDAHALVVVEHQTGHVRHALAAALLPSLAVHRGRPQAQIALRRCARVEAHLLGARAHRGHRVVASGARLRARLEDRDEPLAHRGLAREGLIERAIDARHLARDLLVQLRLELEAPEARRELRQREHLRQRLGVEHALERADREGGSALLHARRAYFRSLIAFDRL